MLERAGACVEPVSQVLLHRFEPPLRSHRLLSPDFFKNGLHSSETAPWWPSFLDSIRCLPQAGQIPCRPTRTTVARPHGSSPRKGPLQRRQKPQSTNAVASKRSVRAYSRTAVRSWDLEVAQDSGPSSRYETSASAQIEAIEQEPFSGTDLFPDANVARSSSGGNTQSLDRNQQRMEQLLHLEGFLSPDSTTSSRDEIWELFIALPDQESYASQVLQNLATSSEVDDLNHAMSAYAIIPLEDRTQNDYNTATDVAARRKRYPMVLQICKEAMDRGLGEACRQTALLGFLRAGLYKSAARLWDECWGRETALYFRHKNLPTAAVVEQSSVQLIDDCHDLPEIFIKTQARLNHVDALLSDSDRQCLLRIVQGLGWRIVFSGSAMSAITLEGLFAIFKQLESSQSLTKYHFIQAMRTLVSTRTPRNRYDMAVALYRNFLLRFSEPVPETVLHGLLYLCREAGAPREALEYLLDEYRRGNAIEASGNSRGYGIPSTCPGPGEYELALKALSRQGDVEGVAHVYAQFITDHGHPKTVRQVAPHIYVHAVVGDVPAAQKAFDELQSQWQFTPEEVCWTILMTAHARSDEPHRVFDVLDDMIKHNVKPDGMTYNVLGSVCTRVGDESTVLSLLELATQQGSRNLVPLLSTLVEVFCLNDDIEKAEDLLLNLDRFDFEGSPVRIWNTLLRHQAYESSPSTVAKTQEQMKRAGVKPDEMTYATTMAALIHMRKTNDALKILRSLHFSSSISATPFLYSLILHGFQKEGNRDMVNTIFREMQDRFGVLTPSAKLSMLRSEQQRGYAKSLQQSPQAGKMKVNLGDALVFLEQYGKYVPSDKATKSPQPGFGRRKPHEAVPSIFTETVTEALAMHGKPLQASGLLQWYDDMSKLGIDDVQSIRALTTRMLVASRLYQREEVDRLWLQILQIGIKTSLSPLRLRQTSIDLRTNSPNPGVAMQELIDKMMNADVSIQLSRRLALALPLGRYIMALNEQGRHSDLIKVVELFPQLGFSLTSKNWNNYVQALCNSPDPEHQVLAFSVFDRVLFPNMPSFRALIRGKWIDPSIERLWLEQGSSSNSNSSSYVSRKALERSQPEKPIPRYETVIWLASVIQDFWKMATRKLTIADGARKAGYLQMLQDQHPALMTRISRLPFQKDRFQRILLHRTTPVYGGRVRFENYTVSRPGATTTTSVVSQLPVESIDWVSRTLKSRRGRKPETMAEDISLAEAALGEIVRTPLFRDGDRRWETTRELQGRIQRTELEYLELVEEMERNIKQTSLVMNEATGDPVYQHDWAALANGSSRLTDEQIFDAAGSTLAQPTQPLLAPRKDATSPLLPDLDARVTPEMRAKIRSTRAALPRPRIRNTPALFNKLLPLKPIRSSVDRAFSRAKANRRLRLAELRQAQQLNGRDSTAEGDNADDASELAAFSRLRKEQAQRDQEMQQLNSEMEHLKQAQARRVSGSMSDRYSRTTELRSAWPASFPMGDAGSGPSQAADAQAGLSKKDQAERLVGLFRSSARRLGTPGASSQEDEEHGVAPIFPHADDMTRLPDPKTLRSLGKREAKRLRAEHRASLQRAPRSSTEAADEENEDDKPFGGWSQGGDGFKSI